MLGCAGGSTGNQGRDIRCGYVRQTLFFIQPGATLDTLTFLRALYGNERGFIELRPTTAPAMFLDNPLGCVGVDRLNEHLTRLERNPKMLPYFGVALRREPTNGRYENCSSLTVLYADCDFKEHGEKAVRKAVEALPYEPSIIVNSGNGLHLYWRLLVPLREMGRASKLLDAWVRTISVADWGVNDVPRVLRLPGTLNHKYDPPRPCVLEHCDETSLFDANELEIYAKQMAVERGESVPEAGVIAPAWILPESIGAGERHGSLYKFMRSLQSRYALTFDEVFPLIQAVNKKRCSPPIAELELRRYLVRGWRSADRAGFERPARLAYQDDGREL